MPFPTDGKHRPLKDPKIEDKYECERCGSKVGDILKCALERISDEHGQKYWTRPYKLCTACRKREPIIKVVG